MICRNDLYRGHSMHTDTQLAILRLARDGLDKRLIAAETKVHPAIVAQVLENGVVLVRALKKPERCECGALLVAAPCLRCQLIGSNNDT